MSFDKKMTDIDFIIYSHTEYLDILEVQLDHLDVVRSRKILLLNKNEMDLQRIYSKFDEVIFYDDSLPYASRLLSLSALNSDYVLPMHDMDILLNFDEEFLKELVHYSRINQVDRIDLQLRARESFDETINFSEKYDVKLVERKDPFRFLQSIEKHGLIYNVGPSIWRLDSLMKLMNKFKDKNYREVESMETQVYCSENFKFYSIDDDSELRCGYFRCSPLFVFLHITHGGRLLPIRENNLEPRIQEAYEKMIKKHLGKFNRQFRESMS